MPYIGRELDRGNYLKLDDISSSFNNSLTTFNLTNGGKAFYPGSAFSILVVLAGVVQEPETAYQINQAQITFASAPLAGDQFFCIALGVALGVNTPANGSVNGTQLAKPFNYDGYFYLDDTNNRVGIATATPQKPLHVVGEGQFDSVRVLGDLTVDGTTTTLDTVVTEVDKLEVLANNNTVAVAVTQSGSGDAAIFMGGNVGIGDDDPDKTLVVKGADSEVVIDDTNGTPLLRLRNNGSTGSEIALSSSNDLIFTSGGNTERLRITSNGFIGISNTSPELQSSAARNLVIGTPGSGGQNGLTICSNTSGTNNIYFGDSSSGQGESMGRIVYSHADDSLRLHTVIEERLRIASDGKVGIGSDDPQSQFEVHGTSPIIRSKHSTSQAYTQINHDGTVGYLDWSSGSLLFRGASNTERLRITSGGALSFTGPGSIQNEAADTVTMLSGGTASNSGANIVLYGQSHASDANVIRIRTGTTDRLRIDSAGRLLLGTVTEGSSSADDLTVATSAETGITIRSGTSNPGNIFFSDGESGLSEYRGFITYAHADDSLRFATVNTERLRITDSGNVGISSDTPAARLDVYKDFNGVGAGTYAGRVYGIDLGVSETGVRFVTKGTGDLHNASDAYLMHGISNGITRFVFGANGNVGIGTNTSLVDILTISDTNPKISIRDAGTERAFIEVDSSDNLVINNKSISNLIFETSDTERLRIDSDGRLLANGAAATNAWAGGDDLIIGNTNSGTRTGITLVSHSGSDGGIYWSDGTGTNAYRGQIAYNHANDTMSLYTAAAARLRITSDGKFGFGTNTITDFVDILYGQDAENIVVVRGADNTSEYAAIGVYGGNAVITGGGTGSTSTGIVFRTAASGTEVEKLRITSDGKVGISSATPKTDVDISQKTGAVALPQGTTAQRPSGSAPYIRKNTTNNALEYFDGTSWVEIITDYFPTGSVILG